jgi:hypothetical protein
MEAKLPVLKDDPLRSFFNSEPCNCDFCVAKRSNKDKIAPP